VAQANKQCLIGALLQQGARALHLSRVKPWVSNDRVDAVQLFVTLREKVLEAETLPCKRYDSKTIAFAVGTARSDWGLCRGGCCRMQTFFRMMHVPLAFC